MCSTKKLQNVQFVEKWLLIGLFTWLYQRRPNVAMMMVWNHWACAPLVFFFFFLLWHFMTSTVPCRCPLHHNACPLPSPSLLSFSLCLLQLLFWVCESAASSSCIGATLAAFASETRKTPTPSPAQRGVGLISGVQGDLRCRWKYFFRKPQPG